MKLFSQNLCPRALAVVCAVAGAGLFTTARADEWDKLTTLTVNQPIQVANKVLDPGKYVLKLVDSSSDRNLVLVYNADQTHLIETVRAVPAYRVQPTGSTRLTYWETPPGTARAVRDWFYPGDFYGQQFPYPKHPAVLQASATTTNVPPPAAVSSNSNAKTANNNAATNNNAENAQASQTQTEPQAAPPPQPAGEQSADRSEQEQPQELAQNTPPPAPAPAPSTQPEAQQNSKQQSQQSNQAQQSNDELPKTASPFPLYGLGGVTLIGLSMMLRRKRVS